MHLACKPADKTVLTDVCLTHRKQNRRMTDPGSGVSRAASPLGRVVLLVKMTFVYAARDNAATAGSDFCKPQCKINLTLVKSAFNYVYIPRCNPMSE